MNIAFAVLVWAVGFGMGVVWLRVFWQDPRRVPAAVVAAPLLAALFGLGGWRGYDFAFGHWVGDISFTLLVFSLAVAASLLFKRSTMERRRA